jgi:hypothetical protein
MFCPQCGQQQVSNEVRFCSRCGFQLGGVTGLLATGGNLPVYQTENVGSGSSDAPRESPRRRGVRQGTTMLLLGLVLTPVLAIIIGPGAPNDFPNLLIPLSAILLIFGGFLRMLYALIFEEGSLKRKKTPETQFNYTPPPMPGQFNYPTHNASALPPGQGIPARGYAPPRRTSDMSAPPSVTESTTQLLDEKKSDSPSR